MTNIAIRAENLSKSYDLSSMQRNTTLKDQIAQAAGSLFRRREGPKAGERLFWALKDISFEIRHGEVIGIIGHNGAGKSTLLKIISQITVPTSGRADIYGRVGSLLEVGTGFHPDLTGRENVYLNGAVIGMRKEDIRRRFDEIVDFAGIGNFLDVPVKRYSSGMYVRLGFSVAVHLEPEILLVDEVLAVGDAAFQKKCLDKISSCAKEGRTILFISHNMIAVNSLCKRVIWISSGEIIQDGPSSEIVTRYLGKSMRGENVSEERWENREEAPGNDAVRLYRIAVRRQNGSLSGPLTMQSPFQVEIEFWNQVPDSHLHVTLHLCTAEGIIAFTTGAMNQRSLPAGLFRSVCHFPGHLLNSGLHRFNVLVVKDSNTVIFSHESSVPIDITDVQKREGHYYGREPGVVQPVLQWSTEYLGADAKADSPHNPQGACACLS